MVNGQYWSNHANLKSWSMFNGQWPMINWYRNLESLRAVPRTPSIPFEKIAIFLPFKIALVPVLVSPATTSTSTTESTNTNTNTNTSTTKDESRRQLEKDYSRDRLIINNRRVEGKRSSSDQSSDERSPGMAMAIALYWWHFIISLRVYVDNSPMFVYHVM